MRPTRTLPENYQPSGEINLSQDRRLFISVNFFSIVIFFASAWGFYDFLKRVRPFGTGDLTSFIDSAPIFSLGGLIAFIGSFLGMLVVHEAIHGFFFWIITHAAPEYGFRGTYAFAAAPSWYIPRGRYLIIGISPLVVISLAGMLAMLFVPVSWLFYVLMIMVLNVSGATGDIIVVAWLAFKPVGCCVRDRGDSVSAYIPAKALSPAD